MKRSVLIFKYLNSIWFYTSFCLFFLLFFFFVYFFVLCEGLHLNKCEDVVCKCNNNFYPNRVRKNRNKNILVPKLHFSLIWSLTSRKIRRCWFQIWQMSFQILPKITPITHFWTQTYFIYIAWNRTFRQIQECCFQIWQELFDIPVKKHWNKTIFVPILIFISNINYINIKLYI